MYRQIWMHNDHRPLQLILWRDNPSDEFTIYQLNTVTYGTTSAPYLAIKCLQTLAIENKTQFPSASNTILQDFYVDDLLTGADDLSELSIKCQQISSILSSGGFNLRKWASNHPHILSNLNTNNDAHGILTIGPGEYSKTLGIKWVSSLDLLKYDISNIISKDFASKREILSDISKIFDPLGLISPCIILSKIIIQQLWSYKLAWDDPVPTDLFAQWNQFRAELLQLNNFEIPRGVIEHFFVLTDIHIFCDASNKAYASAVYVRSKDIHGNYKTSLLCAKTKVAPLKIQSIPRLELCAALLAADLAVLVKRSLQLNAEIYFWSDSQIVLNWIKTEPSLLEVFVANRVSKIQSLTSINNWNYINTKQNPADIASRGVFPSKLIKNTLWWHGPGILQTHWGNNIIEIPIHQLPEVKKKQIALIHNSLLSNNIVDNLFNKSHNLHKLKRIFTYCIRFVNNIKGITNQRKDNYLTVVEINDAYNILLKLVQYQSFSDEIDSLAKGQAITKGRLSSLAPFLDHNNILRVGGRLKYSDLDINQKHPILLCSKHKLSSLIMNHNHINLLHPGPQLLLASVRQNYWIIGGRNLAKKIVKNCITCFKFKPTPLAVPMGPLPNERIKIALPFTTIGIDYAGPFTIKYQNGRTVKLSKCYVAIFICFVTKAVHLDLVEDLTTQCFFACFTRFSSRRGIPNHVYSDNGSTFRGAHNQLKELSSFLYQNQSEISKFALKFNIQWHFTPPYSPNFGGLWEAAVKSFKYHFKRTLLNVTPTFQQFSTILINIEGILNSRPLFAMSSDPNDFEPLTPSHFLIGRPITSIPSPDVQQIPINRLNNYENIIKLKQQFWSRWSMEYITNLHQSYKWKENTDKLKLGTLVLIKQNNIPPHKWLMGRVQNLIIGKDGIKRVAQIKISNGLILRSTRHLYPLPLQDEVLN